MAERVVLHVGVPKTGSTFVQEILWANRDALLRQGILLPGSRAAHYQAMGDLRRGLWYDPSARWTWDRLVDETRSWPGTVVISEEMLGAATADEARRAVRDLAPAAVHVVVVARDLWRTIPSSWQQAVRARGISGFREYVASLRTGSRQAFWDHQTPLPVLRRWGGQLPPEQRHLVTVPPPGSDRNLLWQRFHRAVGIPDGVCRVDEVADNPSLGAAETELLRRVNIALGDEYPLSIPYKKVVRRHLVTPVLMRRPRGARFGAPLDIATWVAGRAEEMVTQLRDYPCQVWGDLDDLVPTAMSASAGPDDLTDGELLDLAVQTIVDLLRRTELDLAHRDADRRADWRHGLRRRVGRAAHRLGIRSPGG
ncbi:MAG: hypothetical protein WCA46_03780 [Actinocatenispora sp.]